MSIAILCPTHKRPLRAERMIRSVANTTTENCSVYLAVSEGSGTDYRDISDRIVIRVPDFMPTVHKWNRLATESLKKNLHHKLFMLGADDMVFATPGWDKALLDHYNSLENKIHVYALQDSRDPLGTPHPIVTREYMDAMGYFLPPIFMHWFCDTWTVDVAKYNNCFTHFTNYELVHDKPSDQGAPDETHTSIRNMGWHQRDAYVSATCKHFLEAEKQRLMHG